MTALLLLLLPGCGPSPGIPPRDERIGLVEALRALPDADAAMARCRTLGEARADCTVAAVEARPDHPEALAWCDALTGLSRDECHFQRAERTRSLPDCDRAGVFADDCRLHVWSARVPEVWPPGPWTEAVPAVRAAMVDAGIDPADRRFWSAAFRHALLTERPLDRARCDALSDEALREECRLVALIAWNDLLNRARDTGTFPCDGSPLPDELAYTADADLDRILQERRRGDLCRQADQATEIAE